MPPLDDVPAIAELMLDDLRAEVRYRTHLPARLLVAETQASVVIENISRSGLQFSGSMQMLRQLLPNQGRRQASPQAPLRLYFDVPVEAGGVTTISICCQQVYCRRVAADQFAVGCFFSAFERSSELHLASYLNTLRPE